MPTVTVPSRATSSGRAVAPSSSTAVQVTVALVPLSPAPGLWTLAVISVTGLVLGIRSLRHPAHPRPPLP